MVSGRIILKMAPNDRGDGVDQIQAHEFRRGDPLVSFMLFTKAKLATVDYRSHDDKHDMNVRQLPLDSTNIVRRTVADTTAVGL